MLTIDRLDAFVLRSPIATPVQTSFGIMRDRPALFVRLTDRDGAHGWGEVWCNFPSVGAEHRARLLDSVFAPLLQGVAYASPAAAFEALTARTEVLAIQSAEPGPIAQCIAGLDIALWDLHARRLGQPLWRVLGGTSPEVPVYASGLNPTQPERLAAEQHAQGYRAFKLKVGFGTDRDLGNLRALRQAVGDCALMVDANQAWDLQAATEHAAAFAPFGLRWLEEPLRATRPWDEWRTLAARAPMPLAAGENLASHEAFAHALEARCLGVVQPDLAKWGGFSACLPVARQVLARGLRYCPHFLGAGVGLLASAHLLAAAGGDGMLEVDANPNPLRTATCGPVAQVVEGRVRLSERPGLGDEPDLAGLCDMLVAH
jgi:L-alanine-DL-glutamate epimerase-like enolase superfamily enzyme